MTQHRRARGGAVTARRFAPTGAILAFLTTTALVLGTTAGPAAGDETDAVAVTDTVAPEITEAEEVDPADSDLIETPEILEGDGGELDDAADLNGELDLDNDLGLDGLVDGLADLQVPGMGTFNVTLPTNYLEWEASDATTGELIGGATFQLQRATLDRWGRVSWEQDRSVTDNVGQLDYVGLDLNPEPGQFRVGYSDNARNTELNTNRRYRVRPVSEGGYGLQPVSGSYVEMSGNGQTPQGGSWTVHNFGNFEFNTLSGTNIIRVKKSDMRTSLTTNGVAAENVVGARFALYSSRASTDVLDTCEIKPDATECVFENVPNMNSGDGYWVGELDPAPGTDAYFAYSKPITQLKTGSANNGPQNYRYSTGRLNGNRDVTVPRSGNEPSESSGSFANRLKNPPLTKTCDAGINVAMVLDLSGSIEDYRNNMAQAASGLVDGLTGTPSSVALFSFSTGSPATEWTTSNTNNVLLQNRPTPVSVETQDGANTVKRWYSRANGTANFQASGGTNWDAALFEVAEHTAIHEYDIVFVLTDGDPTFSNPGSNGREGTGNTTAFREVERAVLSANAVKQAGARVVSIGVGDGVDNSAANLAAISGTNSTGASLSDIDYTITDWEQLAQLLNDFAQEISCQATVTVEKLTVDGDGEPTPAEGWEFTTTATGPEISPEEVQKTSDDGSAKWNLQFGNPSDSTSVNITETGQEGWSLENLVCKLNDEVLQVDLDETVTINDVGIGDNVHCVFTNSRLSTNVTVIKHVLDADDQTSSPRKDWEVSATATGTGIGQKPTEAKQKTDDEGKATWQLTHNNATSTADIAVSETQQDGFRFHSGVCEVTDPEGVTSETTLDDENGTELKGIKPGSVVECTFVNRPSQSTLTLIKKIQGVDGVDGTNFDPEAAVNQWTLTATPKLSGEVISGNANDDGVAVDKKDVEPGEFTLSEALQADYEGKASGYELDQLTCVDTSEEGAQSQIIELTGEPGIKRTGTVTVEDNQNLECTYTNRTLPGVIEWEKVTESGHELKDSVWELKGPGANDISEDITSDTNIFRLENLVWGDYTLTETQAPAGFEWEEGKPPSFDVVITPPNLQWKATSVEGKAIENKQVQPVTLPIAGGTGTWMYLSGGLVLLLTGLGGWLLVSRRREIQTAGTGL